MKLSEEIKLTIKTEYETWFNEQYGDKSIDERKALGAFFTPPELSIKMIEQFESIENKTILDPTCGAGNLLAACIIAGADPNKIYGNELDEHFVEICRNRLKKFGVPAHHIHRGDAMSSSSLKKTSFTQSYRYIEYEKEDLW